MCDGNIRNNFCLIKTNKFRHIKINKSLEMDCIASLTLLNEFLVEFRTPTADAQLLFLSSLLFWSLT